VSARPTQTYKTVAALAITHSNLDFWYTLGDDSYVNMATRQKGSELQAKPKFILVSRNLSTAPIRENVYPIKINGGDGVNSTFVRESVANGLSIEGLTCESIRNYITMN
jgi:nicotinic acid mononucleotide adenylyltransferase